MGIPRKQEELKRDSQVSAQATINPISLIWVPRTSCVMTRLFSSVVPKLQLSPIAPCLKSFLPVKHGPIARYMNPMDNRNLPRVDLHLMSFFTPCLSDRVQAAGGGAAIGCCWKDFYRLRYHELVIIIPYDYTLRCHDMNTE